MRYAIVLLLMLAAPAWAQDATRGKLLYDTHCVACHYERIHKRDPARSLVRTVTQLRLEVAQRAANTGQRFTLADLDDIAEYLNRTHYKLKN
ncbi:MAG: hypothetical protein ABI654_16425 [Betaproteobacteria bacterium]